MIASSCKTTRVPEMEGKPELADLVHLRELDKSAMMVCLGGALPKHPRTQREARKSQYVIFLTGF
jgi:hypothetical protein